MGKQNKKLCWFPECEQPHTSYFKLKLPGLQMEGKFCSKHLSVAIKKDCWPWVERYSTKAG